LFDTPQQLEKALLFNEDLAKLVIAIILFDANEGSPQEAKQEEE